MSHGDHTSGHSGTRTSAGAARRSVRIPGVVGRSEEAGFGRYADGEFRGVGLSHDDQTGSLVPLNEFAVLIGYVVAQKSGPLGEADSSAFCQEILEQKWYSCKGPVRHWTRCLFAGVIVHRCDNRVENWVYTLDTLDGRLHNLDWLDLLFANQLGQCSSIRRLKVFRFPHGPTPS